MRPLRGAALRAVGGRSAGADVGEKLVGRRRPRGLRERAPDVDAGVIVRSPDRGAPVGLDVDERRQVELLGSRAVAGLPDREQLREPASVPRGQRRFDGIERVRERRRDLVRAEVLGARLDVVVVGLEPLVIVRGDPVTEDVDGLGLTLEPDGQLLGDERVRKVLERQRAGDRVVIGDRDEIHPATLGEFVDLFGWGGAFGQVQERWIPSFDSSDAVEWTCISARVVSFMDWRIALQMAQSVKKALHVL